MVYTYNWILFGHQKEDSDNCYNSHKKINTVGQLIYDKGGKNIQVEKTTL